MRLRGARHLQEAQRHNPCKCSKIALRGEVGRCPDCAGRLRSMVAVSRYSNVRKSAVPSATRTPKPKHPIFPTNPVDLPPRSP